MYVFIYICIHLQIIILNPSRYLKSIPTQVFCINFSRRIQILLFQSHACKFISFSIFIVFIINYSYSYIYLCIYTPSYQHFKAFPVSNINSETSFVYQLFKENSNFIGFKPVSYTHLTLPTIYSV